MNRNLCSLNNFWGTFISWRPAISTSFSLLLSLPPVDSVILQSRLIERSTCKEFFSGLWSSKQGSPGAWTLAKLGTKVMKFLQECLELEPGISNGCLAQVSPISSKMLIRIGVTTREVKYIVFLWMHCPVKATAWSWESFHVRCGSKARAELWAEPCNQLGGKN